MHLHANIVAIFLIVDDDRDIVEMLRQLLILEGHTVLTAYSGQDGIDALRTCRPDAILLDVEMPILSGPDMAYRMFEHNCGDELLPILILSGASDVNLIAKRVGTPYFLCKPYKIDALLSMLDRILTEHIAPLHKKRLA